MLILENTSVTIAYNEFDGVEHSGGGVIYTPPPEYFFNPCPSCNSNHTYPLGILGRLGIGGFISEGRREQWRKWDKGKR